MFCLGLYLYQCIVPCALQIDHLQDALTELRESIKVSADNAESQKKISVAEAEARAEADRALLQVSLASSQLPWGDA